MTNLENKCAHPQFLLPISVEYKASPEIQAVREKIIGNAEKFIKTAERIGPRSKRGVRQNRENELVRTKDAIERQIRVIEYADVVWKLGKTWRLEFPRFYPNEEQVRNIKKTLMEKRASRRNYKSR